MWATHISEREIPDQYVVHEEHGDGHWALNRVGPAPDRVELSLELLRTAHVGVLRVHRSDITLLGDEYRVVGWCSRHEALMLRRVRDDATNEQAAEAGG